MAGAVGGRASQPRAHKRTDALRTGAAGRVYFANTGPQHHQAALSLHLGLGRGPGPSREPNVRPRLARAAQVGHAY